MADKPLAGQVCLVTGASRGLGKGIALQLGQAGATVYITGRTLVKEHNKPGSLQETAEECDHNNDEETKAVFERIDREQDGQLDILVNNAISAVRDVFTSLGKKFWERQPALWDDYNNIGVRNHYVCTVYAARMMVKRKKGLIVGISSMGGMTYLFGVPYNVGKAAFDRIMTDTALELRGHDVACISLWPGATDSEEIVEARERGDFEDFALIKTAMDRGETVEYSGKCIVALATDKNIMSKSGRIMLTPDIGDEFKFKDINGRAPANARRIGMVVYMATGWDLDAYLPSFLNFKLPFWLVAAMNHKF